MRRLMPPPSGSCRGESENAKASAPQGVRLTSSSTYNFETQFLYNKETTIDGMETG